MRQRTREHTLLWGIVLTLSALPWIAHFAIAWWAGLLAALIAMGIYDRLFVPKRAICMGMMFIPLLSSAAALLGVDVLLLIEWLRN